MTICVIEDKVEYHRGYVLALRNEFGNEAKIVPTADQPCATWESAKTVIAAVETTEELVILLDLMLRDDVDAENGLKQAGILRLDYPNATILALTSWAQQVKNQPDWGTVFDAVIDKQNHASKDHATLRKLFRAEINSARQRRCGYPKASDPVIQFHDSLGLRLAEAAMTREGLVELISRETSGWRELKVNCLTSGNSGAHVLRVSGHRSDSIARIVLKVAPLKRILEAEAAAAREYGPVLDHFGGKLAGPEGGVQELRDRSMFYCRQVSIAGSTLYELALGESEASAAKAFQAVLKILAAQYRQAVASGNGIDRDCSKCFEFRPDHPHRILDACDRLQPAAELLRVAGVWPNHVADPVEMFACIREIVRNWQAITKCMKSPFWAVQHGDLHGGNVMYSEGQISFIDLARFGVWPLGYDMSRLSTHARVHLPWQKDDQDWIMHDLESWSKEDFGCTAHAPNGKVCPLADTVDNAYGQFLKKHCKADLAVFAELYSFFAVSDLLRMISYTSLSHYKRIWIGISIWKIANRMPVFKTAS